MSYGPGMGGPYGGRGGRGWGRGGGIDKMRGIPGSIGGATSTGSSGNTSTSNQIGFGVPSYPCKRCGRLGHHVSVCLTNGDPSYDKPLVPMKIHNISSQSIVKVKDLTGIDTRNKTVSLYAL